MSIKVKLSDVIDAMEFQSYDNVSLLNIKTGQVVFINKEFLSKAEDDEPYDDMNDWMQEEMKIAYDIIEHDDHYRDFPEPFEINEYQMMERFCFAVDDERKQNRLLDAIKGKGAFRRFKDTVAKLGLANEWYATRDECYKQIAREYCEDLGLDYVE